MSDFDDFEFNSSELGDVGSSNDKKDKPSTNSSDNKKEDDFKLPELPQAKQKNLSIINFSALKPPTGSSITISDGTNESLNVSRPPLLPARLTSIMSTPSQNQTSTEEEHKPKFDLPPLFGDLGGDDDDDEDEPNLGPINFPTDLDKKDQNDAIENKEKMDSITINSVSNNTSLFFNANRTIPDSPLKNNEFFDDENNNLNNSMKSNADQSLSQNNDLKPLDNFGDEIDAPHPLIPLRKVQSTSSFASQSPVKINHSASKPSFLNINEIKNIKPGEPVNSNISEQKNNGLGSLNTINTTPEKSAMKVSSDNENQKENDINEDKNDKLNVMEIDDDDMNFSMGLSSDDEKQDQSKKNQNQNSPIKNAKTPPNTEKINSNPSSGQKNSQIHMTNDTQSTIPSQSKLAPSSLNDTEFNDNFFVDTEDQSKSQEPAESENEQSNQPIFPANPISNETFTSNVDGNDDDDDDDFAAFDQFVKDNKTSEVESDKPTKQVEPQKQTPQNSQVKITPKSTETKKIKTELGESAQKVKQSIKQAANKQQNRNQQIQQQQQQQQFQQQQQQQLQQFQQQQQQQQQQFQQQPKQQQQQQQQQQPQQLQQQPKQQLQQQVISPPIKNTTESPMVSGSQSPSPPNSSSGSFHEREQINNNNKTQTMVNITKTEEQLSSVSLHLESDQPVKKRATKMAIEIGVENAFDSASAQFQRLFMNEFASMMRPTFQMPYDTDIDNFIDYLSKDINKELSSITKSYSPNSRKIRGISEKIEFLFDQGKDVLNEKLANSYEADLQRRASNYQKLRNLQSLVDDLNKTFSSKVTKSMKVIDNYLKDSQMVRSNKLMKAQVMQKNLRELTLERMHLEAKVNRQLNEFEEIDRRQNEVIMSYISFVTDSGLYDYGDDEKAVIMKKIARSITMISSDLDKVTYDGLIEMSNEGQCQINEERAKIRDEYTKIDGIAEKLKLLKQANESKKSSKKKDSKKKKA